MAKEFFKDVVSLTKRAIKLGVKKLDSFISEEEAKMKKEAKENESDEPGGKFYQETMDLGDSTEE